jgi:F0F1-type ATP synthase membrane subunit a
VTVFTSSLPESEWPFPTLAANFIIPAAIEGFVEPTAESNLIFTLSLMGVITLVYFGRKRKEFE